VTNAAAIAEWTTRDIKAMSIIYNSIEPSFQRSVEGSNSSTEMWNRLLQEFASTVAANAAMLLNKFHTYVMDSSIQNNHLTIFMMCIIILTQYFFFSVWCLIKVTMFLHTAMC